MTNKHKDVVDFPFSFNEIDPVFDLMNFLDDRDGLIKKFKPQVIAFLDRQKFFPVGVLKSSHKKQFPKLIASLIRKEIEAHFNFNPEQILILTEIDLIDLLTDGYYFNIENYLKES